MNLVILLYLFYTFEDRNNRKETNNQIQALMQ